MKLLYSLFLGTPYLISFGAGLSQDFPRELVADGIERFAFHS